LAQECIIIFYQLTSSQYLPHLQILKFNESDNFILHASFVYIFVQATSGIPIYNTSQHLHEPPKPPTPPEPPKPPRTAKTSNATRHRQNLPTPPTDPTVYENLTIKGSITIEPK
jgi:hypothetical protein